MDPMGCFTSRMKGFFLKPVPPAPTFHIQALGSELPDPRPHDQAGIQVRPRLSGTLARDAHMLYAGIGDVE